jgi:hypothetical protein
MNLSPAYGRDYKSRAAVIADLKAGKDFIALIWGRRDRPINLSQLKTAPFDGVTVRYSANRKVAVIKRSELE